MNKKGIIFDLDGVLISTDEWHYLAWKKIADKKGIYFDREINNRLRGVSRMDSLEIIMERYEGKSMSAQEKEELANEKNEIYKNFLLNLSKDDIEKGVRKTLENLRDRGYLLAIGSSSKNAKLILEKTMLTDMFAAISDGTNIEKSKPDPEVFIKAAKFLGLEPSYCMVVEDSRAGIDAAKACNMTAVAMGAAKYYEKADFSIGGVADLIKIRW